MISVLSAGEHQMELLDFVAAKFHEEGGVFKLLVSNRAFLLILILIIKTVKSNLSLFFTHC